MTALCWRGSRCRGSRCSPSERRGSGRGELGLGRPPTLFWLVLAALVVWGGIGYMKSVWKSYEFEGRVRSTVLSNPVMKQPELLDRLSAAAAQVGVTLDRESVAVDRGARTVLAAGGISAVRLRYAVPVRILVFQWDQNRRATVEP